MTFYETMYLIFLIVAFFFSLFAFFFSLLYILNELRLLPKFIKRWQRKIRIRNIRKRSEK